MYGVRADWNWPTMNLRLAGYLILAAALIPYLWKNRRIGIGWLRFYVTGKTLAEDERYETRSGTTQ